jgi:hypothetical protein
MKTGFSIASSKVKRLQRLKASQFNDISSRFSRFTAKAINHIRGRSKITCVAWASYFQA